MSNGNHIFSEYIFGQHNSKDLYVKKREGEEVLSTSRLHNVEDVMSSLVTIHIILNPDISCVKLTFTVTTHFSWSTSNKKLALRS